MQDEKVQNLGWTAEEYAACPELASRLHTRILDLQDAMEVALGQLETSSAANMSRVRLARNVLRAALDDGTPS